MHPIEEEAAPGEAHRLAIGLCLCIDQVDELCCAYGQICERPRCRKRYQDSRKATTGIKPIVAF